MTQHRARSIERIKVNLPGEEMEKEYKIYPIIMILVIIASCVGIKPRNKEPEKGFDLLSEGEEVKFGHYVDACIQKDFAVLPAEKHPKIYQAVEEIGRSLAHVSDRSDLNYTFKILNTDLVNAFAGPGGYVYITTGLLEFAKSRDEVAGVMAHELGHVSARHVVKQYRNATYAQTLKTPIILGSKIIGYGIVGNLSQFSALFFLQGYSRECERQADYLGVKYMLAANYNPEGMVSFLKRIWDEKEKEKKEGIVKVFFRSHPKTLERIQDIEKYIEALRKKE